MVKSPNSDPRISVNKLAEFMMARAARQRQILRDQKYPTEFKGMYYREASEAIASAIASRLENLEPIERAVRLLEQNVPDKIGTQRRIDSNLDALETFRLMLDDINMDGWEARLGEQSPPLLQIHNVKVSVRPEVVVRTQGKDGPLVGAMKLHFPRTFPLSAESAGYVSAVVQEWCKVHQHADGHVNGALCPVVDIGSQQIYSGVKATTQRMKDVAASCQMIADLWASI